MKDDLKGHSVRQIEYKVFPKPGSYTSRAERQRFLMKQFGHLMSGSVLDVGCDRKELKSLLSKGITYTGVDVCEGADLVINLDAQPLPFADKSFDVVVCLDVLEHLEKIHFVADELLRVTKRHTIISLPNAWFASKRMFFSDASSKFYGLGSTAPVDRHRWFFNISEAGAFLNARCASKASAVAFYPYFNGSNALWKAIIRRLLPRERYLNLFCPTLWCVVEK